MYDEDSNVPNNRYIIVNFTVIIFIVKLKLNEILKKKDYITKRFIEFNLKNTKSILRAGFEPATFCV